MRSTLYLDSTVLSQPRQGDVANTLNVLRNGAIEFIAWLGRCSRSIRKGETPEQRTEVFQ